MKKFTCVQDIGDLKSALAEAFEIKKDRFKYVELGRNKTLMMIFFNSSLRTRLSTQKAALNLGMNVMVLDINSLDITLKYSSLRDRKSTRLNSSHQPQSRMPSSA